MIYQRIPFSGRLADATGSWQFNRWGGTIDYVWQMIKSIVCCVWFFNGSKADDHVICHHCGNCHDCGNCSNNCVTVPTILRSSSFLSESPHALMFPCWLTLSEEAIYFTGKNSCLCKQFSFKHHINQSITLQKLISKN